jgi:hypothetical protein
MFFRSNWNESHFYMVQESQKSNNIKTVSVQLVPPICV